MIENKRKKPELLAPAGDREMLDTALYFGADAVYAAYSRFGLRAFAGNFDEDGLAAAAKTAHNKEKKLYVTLNVFARNADFDALPPLLAHLDRIGCDGVIVGDIGMLAFVKERAPTLPIHISTQANVTNARAVRAYARLGASRVVLARELSLDEIREIGAAVGGEIELEAFVHGAMCVAYSGRCLLSNVLTGRRSNRGECAQSCRLSYKLTEETSGTDFSIVEDGGAYLLNSRDLKMIEHLPALAEAGVTSFKLEGRAKTAYYAANTVNAYRRALDFWAGGGDALPPELAAEVYKASNRGFTTGFYFPGENGGNGAGTINRQSAKPQSTHTFVGVIREVFADGAVVEMRNRFRAGERLEVLSPGSCHNAAFTVGRLENAVGEAVTEAVRVQEGYRVYTGLGMTPGDMLRRRN
jgi:putative protease